MQAKPETLDKVCGIVKKQLALADDVSITGDSKFAELGADSLDTVPSISIIHFAVLKEGKKRSQFSFFPEYFKNEYNFMV